MMTVDMAGTYTASPPPRPSCGWHIRHDLLATNYPPLSSSGRNDACAVLSLSLSDEATRELFVHDDIAVVADATSVAELPLVVVPTVDVALWLKGSLSDAGTGAPGTTSDYVRDVALDVRRSLVLFFTACRVQTWRPPVGSQCKNV